MGLVELVLVISLAGPFLLLCNWLVVGDRRARTNSGGEMDAASGGGRLQSPPCKVLSGQLRLGVRRDGQPSGWLLERAGGGRAPLDVSVVWMQGTVLEVRPEHNTSLQLLDEAGTFTVVGAAAVPQGKPCTSPGKYVMVMGMVQSCRPEPVVRAVKVTDLSGNPLQRSMWKLEVEDLQQNMP